MVLFKTNGITHIVKTILFKIVNLNRINRFYTLVFKRTLNLLTFDLEGNLEISPYSRLEILSIIVITINYRWRR